MVLCSRDKHCSVGYLLRGEMVILKKLQQSTLTMSSLLLSHWDVHELLPKWLSGKESANPCKSQEMQV